VESPYLNCPNGLG